MALWALRHCTPDVLKGTCYGRLDVPLSSAYPRELEEVRRKLGGKQWDKVYCSPLSRCTRLAGDLNLTYTLEPAILEMDFGQWEGSLWEDIPRKELDAWGENWQTQGPPHGESFQELKTRVERFLERIPQEKEILLVTHGGVIRCLMHILHNHPVDNIFQIPVEFGVPVLFS